MTRALTLAPTLVLAAVLALTSVTSAMARGQAPSMGLAVICTGMGEVMVALDAQGNPTSAIHPCPECTLSPAIEPGRATGPAPAGAILPATLRPGACVHDTARPRHPNRARAPPHPV